MYRISILIILTLSFLISQERTTLHFASPDDNLPGHIINNTSSIADLFTVTNDYSGISSMIYVGFLLTH